MTDQPSSWFEDLDITKKLSVGQGALVGLLIIIVIALGLQVLSVQGTANLANNRNKSMAALKEVQYDVTDMLALTRGVLLTQSDFLAGLYETRTRTFDTNIQVLMDLYEGQPELQSTAAQLARDKEDLDKILRQQIGLAMSRDAVQEAQAIKMERDNVAWPALEKVLMAIDALVPAQKEERDKADALMESAFLYQKITLAIAIGLGTGLAFFLARYVGDKIRTPLVSITEAMRRVAGHDLTSQIPYTDRSDEIGDMGQALAYFRDEMERSETLAAERDADQKAQMEKAEARAEEERLQREREAEDAKQRDMEAARLEALVADFDTAISGAIEQLDSNAQQMKSTAGSMVGVADKTRTQATSVSSAAGEMQGNISTMASAIEEFAASIREVASQIQSAGQMSSHAVTVATTGSKAITELSSASGKIEDVVNLINDIAEQTNLLALNATIEAARAGDAGKGFAVVASEVKNLANQTAKATEDITRQIAEMQGLTNEAVSAMGAINEEIGSLNDVTLAVSSAIEEQEAVTSEISRSVQFASEKTQSVADEIQSVTEGANQTGEASNSVQQVSTQLEELSARITRSVNTFLTDVRSAQG